MPFKLISLVTFHFSHFIKIHSLVTIHSSSLHIQHLFSMNCTVKYMVLECKQCNADFEIKPNLLVEPVQLCSTCVSMQYFFRFSETTNLNEPLRLKETQINETRINETQINETKLKETRLKETQINETRKNETQINETKLKETQINETKLKETKLSETKLSEIKHSLMKEIKPTLIQSRPLIANPIKPSLINSNRSSIVPASLVNNSLIKSDQSTTVEEIQANQASATSGIQAAIVINESKSKRKKPDNEQKSLRLLKELHFIWKQDPPAAGGMRPAASAAFTKIVEQGQREYRGENSGAKRKRVYKVTKNETFQTSNDNYHNYESIDMTDSNSELEQDVVHSLYNMPNLIRI